MTHNFILSGIRFSKKKLRIYRFKFDISYADDIQIFISFQEGEKSAAKIGVTNCLIDIKKWISDKTFKAKY